jgi:hypothetical protein
MNRIHHGIQCIRPDFKIKNYNYKIFCLFKINYWSSVVNKIKYTLNFFIIFLILIPLSFHAMQNEAVYDNEATLYKKGSNFILACARRVDNQIFQIQESEIDAIFAWLEKNNIKQTNSEQTLMVAKNSEILALQATDYTPYKALVAHRKSRLWLLKREHIIALGSIFDNIFYDSTELLLEKRQEMENLENHL